MAQAEERPPPSGTADRSSHLDLTAAVATWLLFLLALPFLEGESLSLESLIGGGLLGALIIGVGFLAASRVRPPCTRAPAAEVRLVLLAVLTGVAVGVVHKGSHLALASLDAGVQALLVERFVHRPDWGSTFSAAVVEEIAFRLFFLSSAAWLAWRLTGDRRTAFWTGLAVSSAIFAVLHLWGRPAAGPELIAAAYRGLIVLTSGLAGCVLGWMFWRWGLLQAMVCHFTVNATVQLGGPLVLG